MIQTAPSSIHPSSDWSFPFARARGPGKRQELGAGEIRYSIIAINHRRAANYSSSDLGI